MHLTLKLLAGICLALGVLGLTSCSTLGYYSQAIGGQLELMRKARPVDEVISDAREPEAVRRKLQAAQRARQFAYEELQLPHNRSYESYVDVGRPAVVWNVVAAPALSVAPLHWCYPVAGCFSYRGYFARREADDYAEDLRRRGFDAYVTGASAYSTLGWFDDPLLSTMLRRSEQELVATLFHELAHQKLHVTGDSSFNEAFAVAVAEEGMRRWYRDNPEAFAAYLEDQARLRTASGLLLATRQRLAALYDEPLPDAEKLQRKRAILDELLADYAVLKANWNGDDGFDGWFPKEINNAHLALTATYQQWVPAFKALLESEGNDLGRFYKAAQQLGTLPALERRERLKALLDAPALHPVSN